jgi:DNA (cytosine-5)-methyltransferase 1
MWPTPRASGQENPESLIKRKGARAAAQHNLTAAVKMMPTPTRRDYKDSGKAVINSTRDSLLGVRVAKENTEQWVKGGGALNPTWVEWLMGYPEEYTVLKDWAILSSRKSSKK